MALSADTFHTYPLSVTVEGATVDPSAYTVASESNAIAGCEQASDGTWMVTPNIPAQTVNLIVVLSGVQRSFELDTVAGTFDLALGTGVSKFATS